MVYKVLILLTLTTLLASCATQQQAAKSQGISTGMAVTPAPESTSILTFDPVAQRLDSLVALSDGDYIHMQISECFGRCEGFVSVFRQSPARFHIYEGQGWIYNEFDRDFFLYRHRKPMVSDMAEGLIERARTTGILKLVDDSTYQMTDQPFIWVRARIGGKTIAVNHAYLGGRIYHEQGLNAIYAELRKILFAPMVGTTPSSEGRK